MTLTPEQQAIEHLTRAKRILILSKEKGTHDSIASVLASVLFLRKKNKQVDGVIPNGDIDKLPSFFPRVPDLRTSIGPLRAFVLSLNVEHVPLEELLYDVHDKVMEITVVPKTGEWTPKDVSFKHGEDRYDLVLALDCPDMASLGKLAREHADFLYRTTIINIDCDPRNEHWGQINLVDLNAVSTTEILYGIFERWQRNALDEDLATALLAGMIAKTKSFRTSNVTPKTLSTASQLVALGARREEIVHGLWRTRSVATLKVWGRALARIEQDQELGMIWTTLTRQDFLETGSSDEAIEDVIDELITYAPEAKITVLIYEQLSKDAKGACVTLHATTPYSALDIGRPFSATGTRDRVNFCLTPDMNLVEGTKMTIERLRETVKALPK